MDVKCRHCGARADVKLPGPGGLFRCAKCRKLNFVLRRDCAGAVRFGEYDLLDEAGQGANAVVCRARRRADDALVAVKLFYSEIEVDSLSRREFMRENELATQLAHPNIVHTECGGEQDGVFFLELEYVDGINLAQYLEYYGAMEPIEALTVGCHVCSALDYVWSSFLSIHRDIKPQNVMVDNHGKVKICDFGMVTEHEQAVVDINAVEGTPYYLSPECVTDGAYQDNRSDVYSLGATLYHIIAGEPPFNYDSLEDVIYARVREAPPAIKQVMPGVDQGLNDVLQAMMSRDPEDRYVTAAECLQDMERVKAGIPPVLVDPSRPKVNQ